MIWISGWRRSSLIHEDARDCNEKGMEAKVSRGRSMKTDKERTMAAFWLDSPKCEFGPVSIGKTYVEIASDLPLELSHIISG
jgi:hypothetical protein